MQTVTQVSLFRARLLLEEGRSQAALSVLETVQPQEEETRYDVTYLRGWCFIQNHRWNDARNVLEPLLLSVWRDDADLDPLPDRERLIIYLLRLGQVAARLAHYDDALTHFSLCLKLLRDRRVHLPVIRIRAHASLAMTYLMKGLCTVALQHYEEAHRLSTFYEEEGELPNISYGICDTKRSLGNFFEAYQVGKVALRLYQEQDNVPLQVRVLNLLGSIAAQLADTETAEDYYMESLRLAEQRHGSVMTMLNYAGLAELRLQQERFEDVMEYGNKALTYAQQVSDRNMAGGVYMSVAKVTLTLAERIQEAQCETPYERAFELFQKAEECLKDTQAYLTLAELYGRWAKVLEHLECQREAIKYWRFAYTMMQKAKAVECQPFS